MRRKLLVNVVWLFFVIASLAIVYVFIQGMGPSDRAVNRKEHIIDLSYLLVGEPKQVNTSLGPIFMLRPSEEQFRNLQKLNDHVWSKEYSGYNKEMNLFVYFGISTRFGCALTHFPLGKSLLTEFNEDGTWYGGYVDPCHDSSYDYAGRTIKTREHTYKGFDIQVSNLNVPDHVIRNKKLIIKLM